MIHGAKTIKTYVFTADGLNHIVGRGSEKLCDDGELIDVILAREQRLSLQHFREDTTSTPNINLNVVLLPSKHDFRRPVVPGRDVSSHLRVLNTRQSEIANLEIAVLIDKNVTRLEITVNNTGGVNVFETTLRDVRRRLRKSNSDVQGSGRGSTG